MQAGAALEGKLERAALMDTYKIHELTMVVLKSPELDLEAREKGWDPCWSAQIIQHGDFRLENPSGEILRSRRGVTFSRVVAPATRYINLKAGMREPSYSLSCMLLAAVEVLAEQQISASTNAVALRSIWVHRISKLAESMAQGELILDNDPVDLRAYGVQIEGEEIEKKP